MQKFQIGSKTFYNLRIAYVGAPEVGKTTNVSFLAKKWNIDTAILTKEGERTITFDLVSGKVLEKGNIVVCASALSVPGQTSYKFIRERVLENVDAIVFVYDLTPDRHEENIEAYHDIKNIMKDLYDKDISEIPVIIQYNKIDLVHELPHYAISFNTNNFPYKEAKSMDGTGILDTFIDSINQISNKHNLNFGLSELDMCLH